MANGVPMELARRVVKRESGGNPRAVSKGNYGLMQIRLGTAKAMGYRGNAKGLLDADTNMTYAMRYLSGALRAAGAITTAPSASMRAAIIPKPRRWASRPTPRPAPQASHPSRRRGDAAPVTPVTVRPRPRP
jgi:soluble lytic murein transglycosylase-like protein